MSSKKALGVSGMLSAAWALVPAPLMPLVALVELPPMNGFFHEAERQLTRSRGVARMRTDLVKEENIRSSLVEGVRGGEARETAWDRRESGELG